MSEIEVPIEKIQEDIHHAALHGDHAAPGPMQSMMNRAALLSAFLAVFAAISALFAGHLANEAMIEQIQSSDHWAHYQAKGIKLAITELRNETNPSEALQSKVEAYKKDQEEIRVEADKKEAESREHLHRHESLAASVTLFQIAIALTAISVLTRKKTFLAGAGLLGLAGLLWMLKSFMM